MACVVKKKGNYYIKYYDVDGRQVWKATGLKSKKAAEEIAKKLDAELKYKKQCAAPNKKNNAKSFPLKTLFREFYTYLDEQIESEALHPKTVRLYRYLFEYFQEYINIKKLDNKTQ